MPRIPLTVTLLSSLVLLLLTLIWGCGPALGLVSAGLRLLASGLLLLGWGLVLLLWRRFTARRRGTSPGAGPGTEAPRVRESSEAVLLREQLLKAIGTLRKSELGRARGRAVLYALPWYLVLGRSGSGKSCAIRCSGLSFPLPALEGREAASGGRPACSWHFSTEGVLLEAPGGWSEAPEAGNCEEWPCLLSLLRRHRPRMPLNGVIVVLSLPELLGSGSQSFADSARQLRERITGADEAFGMKLPVYVLFTKMDLLEGFCPFFRELGEEDRRQVWGASLPHAQGAGFDAADAVASRFDALQWGLASMGRARLGRLKEGAERPEQLSFPAEFRSLCGHVRRFMEILSKEDPFRARPLVRGFCFCSSLQGGEPSSPLGSCVASRFALGGDVSREGPSGNTSFFLEHFFRRVVFPDRFLAGNTSRPGSRRVILLGVGLLVLTLLCAAWTTSFIMNRRLLQESASDSGMCERLLREPPVQQQLLALQLLQSRIAQLQRWRREGCPQSLGWGLYQGDAIEARLKGQCYQALRGILLEPVRTHLEAVLDGFVEGDSRTPAPPGRGRRRAEVEPPAGASHEAAYNALKTYLMLREARYREPSHLEDQLPRHWRPSLESWSGQDSLDESVRGPAEHIIAFFVSQIGDPELPTLPISQERVDRVRQRLRGEIRFLSPYERIYAQIRAEANTRFAPCTMAGVLGDRDGDLVMGSCAVPGAFTSAAWNTYVQGALSEAARGRSRSSDWVLDSEVDNDLTSRGSPEENASRLTELYKADFIREWERFIAGAVFSGFQTPGKSAVALARLASAQASPIRLVLDRAAREAAWDAAPPAPRQGSGATGGLLDRAGRLFGSEPSAPSPAPGAVAQRFALLSRLALGDKGALDGYFDLLQKLRTRMAAVEAAADPGGAARQFLQVTLQGASSPLSEVVSYVDGTLLGQSDEGPRASLRALLLRPVMLSAASLLPQAERDLNRLWNEQVYSAWSSLGGKYPFADSGNDASLADIQRFLKPGEGTLSRFVEGALSGFTCVRGGHLCARSFLGVEARLSPAFLAGVSRLQQAAAGLVLDGDAVRFELQPQPVPGITESYLEIGGDRLVYRNGPQHWKAFTWPAGPGGIQLRLVSETGASMQLHDFRGRLDLMRWLDMARVDTPSSPTVTLEWPIPDAGPLALRGERKPRGIRYQMRLISGPNPLHLKALRNHTLPAHVVRAGRGVP